MNWALYYVTDTDPANRLRRGDVGVFETELEPGIGETQHGVILVAPTSYVTGYAIAAGHRLSAAEIRLAVETYWNGRNPFSEAFRAKT